MFYQYMVSHDPTKELSKVIYGLPIIELKAKQCEGDSPLNHDEIMVIYFFL
jgi:hypothetical protein